MITDLYKSAAYYYARFRPFYPDELVQDITSIFQLKRNDRILDIGSGTGHLAIQLSPKVNEIVAVEPDSEMIKQGKWFSDQYHTTNIRWIRSPAEELSAIPDLGNLKLATFGTSFHWMQQDKVLKLLEPLIESEGGVVVTGSASLWTKTDPWEVEIKTLVQKYLGEKRRAGTGHYQQPTEPFIDMLKRSTFREVQERHYLPKREMNIDQVIGRTFSASWANPALFGDRKDAFEHELRERLLAIEPSGKFIKSEEYYAFFAKRPQ